LGNLPDSASDRAPEEIPAGSRNMRDHPENFPMIETDKVGKELAGL